MRPHEPYDPRHQYDQNHGVEFVKILSQAAPVLAQFHSHVRQGKTPRPRSKERVKVKASAGHARNASGQRNKSSHHWQQTPEKYRQVSPAPKEPVGSVEFTLAHQNPTAVALHQPTAPVAADFIGNQGPQG